MLDAAIIAWRARLGSSMDGDTSVPPRTGNGTRRWRSRLQRLRERATATSRSSPRRTALGEHHEGARATRISDEPDYATTPVGRGSGDRRDGHRVDAGAHEERGMAVMTEAHVPGTSAHGRGGRRRSAPRAPAYGRTSSTRGAARPRCRSRRSDCTAPSRRRSRGRRPCREDTDRVLAELLGSRPTSSARSSRGVIEPVKT